MNKPTIKLDYSVKTLEHQRVLSLFCQHCGSESKETICHACKGKMVKRGEQAEVSSFQRLLKVVSVSGVNVFVNGELVRAGANAFHAEMIAKSLRKQYSAYNEDILRRMK